MRGPLPGPDRVRRRGPSPLGPTAGGTWGAQGGPDDDVDAVFSNGRRSFDLEVFSDRGEPTVAEIEENTLPDD